MPFPDVIAPLKNPAHLSTRSEVLATPSPVPKVSGLYAWFFRNVPEGVPAKDCIRRKGLTLLYVGIAPSRVGSKATLRSRIRQHFQSNAAGSTLRLTLGCLLADQLGIRLRGVGTKGRLTFGVEGEKKLSEWMEQNAFVCWVKHPRPWEVEKEIIKRLPPPLNIEGNAQHPFCGPLSALRSEMRKKAREA